MFEENLNRILGYGVMEKAEDPGGGAETPAETVEEVKPDAGLIPITVLPPELHGRSEAELKFLLSRMADTASIAGTEIRTLREELDGLKRAQNEEPEVTEDPDTADKTDEELLAEGNVDLVVARSLKRQGLLDRFTNLESTSSGTLVSTVRHEIPGFEEHEEEVMKILSDSKQPITRNNIMGAFTMAVGLSELEKRQAKIKEEAVMERPAADVETETTVLPELAGLEKDMFDSSGLSIEEWHAMKDDSSMDNLEVPR